MPLKGLLRGAPNQSRDGPDGHGPIGRGPVRRGAVKWGRVLTSPIGRCPMAPTWLARGGTSCPVPPSTFGRSACPRRRRGFPPGTVPRVAGTRSGQERAVFDRFRAGPGPRPGLSPRAGVNGEPGPRHGGGAGADARRGMLPRQSRRLATSSARVGFERSRSDRIGRPSGVATAGHGTPTAGSSHANPSSSLPSYSFVTR